MKVKRLMLVIAAVFICLLFALYAFLSFDRAGGEVEFEAVVLEINGNESTTNTENMDYPEPLATTENRLSVYQGPLSSITHIGIDGTNAVMEMSEAEQDKVLSVLNSGEWINDMTDCAHDYEFTVINASIRYHSHCGTFIDMTNGCSRRLSENEKAYINEMFGSKVPN